MLKITMDCPARDEEVELARRTRGDGSPEATLAAGKVRPTIGPDDLLRMRRLLESITVREELLVYLVDIIRRTREHDSVLVRARPRATQGLRLAGRAHAALEGRDFPSPD